MGKGEGGVQHGKMKIKSIRDALRMMVYLEQSTMNQSGSKGKEGGTKSSSNLNSKSKPNPEKKTYI
jgi:hypothetical protein